MILFGDTPLINSLTLKKLIKKFINKRSFGTMLAFKTPNPFAYGRVITKGDKIQEVVEQINTDDHIMKAVNIFVISGANLGLCNKQNKTAFTICLEQHRSLQIIKYLALEHGYIPNDLIVDKSHNKDVRAFISKFKKDEALAAILNHDDEKFRDYISTRIKPDVYKITLRKANVYETVKKKYLLKYMNEFEKTREYFDDEFDDMRKFFPHFDFRIQFDETILKHTTNKFFTSKQGFDPTLKPLK